MEGGNVWFLAFLGPNKLSVIEKLEVRLYLTNLTKNSLDYLSTASGFGDFSACTHQSVSRDVLEGRTLYHSIFYFQRFCDKSLHRFIWHKYLCSMLRSVSLSNSGLRHPCGIPLVLHARVLKSIIFSMFLHCISMISPQLHTCMI